MEASKIILAMSPDKAASINKIGARLLRLATPAVAKLINLAVLRN